ncbi:MAG: hypothetical protein RL033_7959 [Pseudomonadota bacterium]
MAAGALAVTRFPVTRFPGTSVSPRGGETSFRGKISLRGGETSVRRERSRGELSLRAATLSLRAATLSLALLDATGRVLAGVSGARSGATG